MSNPPSMNINKVRALKSLLTGEVASGLLLMVAAATAVAWANLADSYQLLWQTEVNAGIAPVVLKKPLLLWINDGLMAIFFLLLGLEIKREVQSGELASVRRAALPIIAAFGGMVAPALLYIMFNAGTPGARGWGIPMATDIAFALGALALLRNRVAPSLRIFLTAVAVTDDLGAVAVIAVFYTSDLGWPALWLAAAILILLMILNRAGVTRVSVYLLLGVVLWVAVLKSGVHATVAAVLLALLIPGGGSPSHAIAERLEHRLQPWVAFVILPLFALANAGVRMAENVGSRLLDPVTLGIIVGLFIGKQIGVAGACWVAVRFGFALLPSRATWRETYGVALLCGIGFTMSLFIATLAFDSSERLEAAKVGVLAGSLLSGMIGGAVLLTAERRNSAA